MKKSPQEIERRTCGRGTFQPGTPVFDYRHPDLQANADAAWLASGTAPQEFSNHATMVAGVMVAANDDSYWRVAA